MLNFWLRYKATSAQEPVCKHIFHIENVVHWPVPDWGGDGSRGTYLLRTPFGSSPRSHSGSLPRWWWCSQCPSSLGGLGRHDRECASTLPELSFACQTVEIKSSEVVRACGDGNLAWAMTGKTHSCSAGACLSVSGYQANSFPSCSAPSILVNLQGLIGMVESGTYSLHFRFLEEKKSHPPVWFPIHPAICCQPCVSRVL